MTATARLHPSVPDRDVRIKKLRIGTLVVGAGERESLFSFLESAVVIERRGAKRSSPLPGAALTRPLL